MIVIVGAGAAGLAAATFAARHGARDPVVLVEGATRPGAKILVSGGSRCNVTNAVVTEADFRGSPPHLVRRVLRSLDVGRTVAFFREIGVALHEEEHGKLFPDSNRSRTVLQALLDEAARRGVALRTGERVEAIEKAGSGFRLRTSGGGLDARYVVLATGGLSLPKSGSDGHGLEIARGLGHTVTPTTPALVPLVLEGAFHTGLSGVAHEAELRVRARGRVIARHRGALLWTHFGISGPVALDASRDWLRARHEAGSPSLEASLLPELTFEEVERELLMRARESPRLSLGRALSHRIPVALADAVIREHGLAPEQRLGGLRREGRRELLAGLVSRRLPVVDSRGYSFAEATAGGVPLAEVDTRTMESRRCPGLYLVGEMLDVDGRLGGFNFQWAWSSGFVAGRGLARASGPASASEDPAAT